VPADHSVRRRRLLQLVEHVLVAPLTLVIAPAGTGKTSLVAGWTADATIDTAWLSPDELDRDVVQFWSGVIAALETLVPGCGDRALSLLRRPSARADAVDQLLADLDVADRRPAVLVIDDFHLFDRDDALDASVTRFALGLPVWLRVVILSRRDPPRPIDRMRSRGQLGEIRFAELQFSPDEAVALLTRMAPDLTESRVEIAVARADGWAAGLQLMALAARSRRAQAIVAPPGEEGAPLIQDSVLHEILATEAPELIDVLYAAAVVPRINLGLAAALTARPDAGELLRAAEGRGLFLTRRGAGGWFDLHALVRDVLTADLAGKSPSRLCELHSRAARWFEDAGEVVIAIEQWLLAERPRDALETTPAIGG
jgi:LuxR family maltose regulon positive regulatory protein